MAVLFPQLLEFIEETSVTMTGDRKVSRSSRPGPVEPLRPIAGRTVWRGSAFQGCTDWSHTLSATELTELWVTVAEAGSVQSNMVDLKRHDFPLPSLGPVLQSLKEEIVNGRGFALIRGLPVAEMSRREAALAFWGIGLHLGRPVSQNMAGHMLGHVKDTGGDFHDVNSRGGYQSRARLPYHTDLGADIVGLLCLQTAKAGGLSSLVSAHAIHNAMLASNPDLVETLAAPIYRDRRGEIPEGKAPYYQAPVFCYHEGYMTTTFVRRFIDSAPRHEGVPPLTAKLAEALARFEILANDSGLRLDMALAAGDMQFVNNLTTLHSRTSFEDHPDAGRKRHLLRLWLAADKAWPLPPEHYERFGTVGDKTRPDGMIGTGVKPNVPLDVE